MEARFGAAAQRELDMASDFYESRRSGLGAEFLDEVHRHIILIKEQPKLGRRLLLNRRMLMLNRFPYRLVYAEEEQIIRIIAIAHASQRPFYWRNRVEEPRPAYVVFMDDAQECGTASFV